jgi:hypothetical protein
MNTGVKTLGGKINPAWHNRVEQEPKPTTSDEARPDAAMKSGDRKIKS